jgi:hypothetical protein
VHNMGFFALNYQYCAPLVLLSLNFNISLNGGIY